MKNKKNRWLRYLMYFAVIQFVVFSLIYISLHYRGGIDPIESFKLSIIAAFIVSLCVTLTIRDNKKYNAFYTRLDELNKEAEDVDTLEQLQNLYSKVMLLSLEYRRHATLHALLDLSVSREQILNKIVNILINKLKEYEKASS